MSVEAVSSTVQLRLAEITGLFSTFGGKGGCGDVPLVAKGPHPQGAVRYVGV